MPEPVVMWFRRDLRLSSNAALNAAAHAGSVVCVYIRDTAVPDGHEPGAAVRWWLHRSLIALRAALKRRGVTLLLKSGDPAQVLGDIARTTGAREIYYNRIYEPAILERDKRLATSLQRAGLALHSHNASLIYEPWSIQNQAGAPYKVFTQYWKRGCLQSGIELPASTPVPKLTAAACGIDSDALDDWRWQPAEPDWSTGLAECWCPGEAGAGKRLDAFIDAGLAGYSTLRDRPDSEHVSRLSPHLQHGEIAPWQIWQAVMSAATGERSISDADVEAFLRELGWREFSHHLLYHFPALIDSNWRTSFDAFPWRDDPHGLLAWQRGRTGYPLVDAGMRELWATGYMHGRVRMVTASFLVKHLRIDWRLGERWFRDTLVDASLAQNCANWQWVAGSGADASPYFRIFNPIRQAGKFDPDAKYVHRWVPELAGLAAPAVHQPDAADADVLAASGVRLGTTYPKPLVEHSIARAEALEAYEAVKAAARL